MTSNDPYPSRSNLPYSLGPGAQPIQNSNNMSMESGGIQELLDIRANYNIHVSQSALELSYRLKNEARHFSLPFDNIPISPRSAAWTNPALATASGSIVIDLIRGCENVSGRRVSQLEAEGLAFYTTRRMLTVYYGQVPAVALGLGMAWHGRKNMKFPFMTPKDPSAYDAFPMKKMALLSGKNARIMWQVTRTNIFVFGALLVCNPLIASIADTRMTVGMYADPRTHDLAVLVKDNFNRLRMNRSTAAAKSQQTESTGTDESSGYGSSMGDQYAGDATFTEESTGSGFVSDAAMQRTSQQPQQSQQPPAWTRGSRPPRSARSQSPTQAKSQSDDIFFDDASPTAGNDPDMTAPAPRRSQPQAGAWSRIRSGATSNPSRQSEQSSTNTAESFSFSSRDEDKQLAKQQAQKEFDAMLDRERREGGADAYQRDMRATEAGEEASSRNEGAWASRRRG